VARAEYRANHDPVEPLNRHIFAFNLVIDRILLKPMAKGYRRAIPEGGRDALRNFLNNLGEPVVFGNDLLQARWPSAATTLERFIANSTFGFAGFSDWAKRRGLPRQTGDFGQTLDRWGFGEGPYLILPVVGPSSPRDAIGLAVDIYIDPFRYAVKANHYPIAMTSGREVVSGIDERARNIDSLEELQREAIDFYASFRSLYRQNRAAQLRHGSAVSAPAPESFYDDPGATKPPTDSPNGK
jgi:phospholipid-binding lipoprotein MlaA